jgi:hypothetical protein
METKRGATMKTLKLTDSEISTLYSLVSTYYGENEDAETRKFSKNCESISIKLQKL